MELNQKRHRGGLRAPLYGEDMQLQAWRTTINNPCDDPPVHITISPVQKMTGVFPWVLPQERAVEMFGQEAVDQIGEVPVVVELSLFLPAMHKTRES
jgi:hypothetical protein